MVPAVLYQRIRDRLDLADSSYLDDLEVGQVCEDSYFELWDILIALMGDEAPWLRQNLVTAAGVDSVDVTVANGVYRMLRLEFASSGSGIYLPVGSLNMTSDPIDTNARPWSDACSFRYFARRSPRADLASRAALPTTFAAWKFYFSPVPSAVYTLRMYYVPPPAITVQADGTYTVFPDEFPEYVVADVCAKMMDKQEGDSAPFITERERIKGRIERYAKRHQMNGPHNIADVRSLGQGDVIDDWMRRR